MKKIAFIGAGSFGFTRTLVKDILSFPAFSDAHISLMDINQERLDYIEKAVNKIVKAGNYPAKVTATTNRAAALEGADGVLITILNGGVDIWRHDIEIPKKYGVDACIGDTRGPSGIFRYLRTGPVMLDICRDIYKYAPKAVVLNYTNPMAMLCQTIQREIPDLTVSGLCHSVQGTAHMLANWIGADMKDVTYTCAGINHMAFYTDFKVKGEDAYPEIRKAIEKPEIYNQEKVRNEMFRHLGYYVTESSGHHSEYNYWFRKRQDLIEKYCLGLTGWDNGRYAYLLDAYLEREKDDNWKKDIENWLNDPNTDISRGLEYAAYIFNAIFGDNEIFEFNGNVLNNKYIEGLPEKCCVEVPVIASKAGLQPIRTGSLPPQCNLLVGTTAQIETLVVDGSLEGDKEKVIQALMYDPLSAAVCSMQEIRDMANEMFEKNKDYLPQF